MESILPLRSPALFVTYTRTGHTLPLACHLSRHLAFIRRIRFPRSVLPRHHRSVSCSGTAPPPLPPPKNGEENGKKDCVGSGRKAANVAAISAAVALACALIAVNLRRRAPVPELPGRSVNIAACINQLPRQLEFQVQNTEQGERAFITVQETRDVVREILFKDPSYLNERVPTTSTKLGREKYEWALSMTLIFIAKKDFRSAKTVLCQAIKEADTKRPKDARPSLLMAVIDMMLAVEATLSSDKSTKEEVHALIASAQKSIADYFDLKGNQGSGPLEFQCTMQETRDVVREILFKDASYLIEREPKTSISLAEHKFDPKDFEFALSLALIFIDKKDFHLAKTVLCKAIKECTPSDNDARPSLLMAVIDMMSAMEATLSSDKSRKEEVDALITSAKNSIARDFYLKEQGLGGAPPRTDTSS